MLLCYVIDSGLSTSLLLLATLIIMFYITLHYKGQGHMTPKLDLETGGGIRLNPVGRVRFLVIYCIAQINDEKDVSERSKFVVV